MSDLEKLAEVAADRAVAGVALKQGDVEKMIEEGVEQGLTRFMERAGIENLNEFRRDVAWANDARKLREALVRHGLMAGIGLIIMAIGTAIWLAIKGAKL